MSRLDAISDLLERASSLRGGASWTKAKIADMVNQWEEYAEADGLDSKAIEEFTGQWMRTHRDVPTYADLRAACGVQRSGDTETSFKAHYGVHVVERMDGTTVVCEYFPCVMRAEKAAQIRQEGGMLADRTGHVLHEGTERTYVFGNQEDRKEWLKREGRDEDGFVKRAVTR